MNALSLNKVYASVSLNNLKKTIMKFLSIMVLGNTRTTGFYTAQYEQVFDVVKPKETKISKRAIRVKAPVVDILEADKNKVQEVKPKRPKINYFAGPHSGFNPHIG
jgi:hypothetical protein